jgi:hypothetical protein
MYPINAAFLAGRPGGSSPDIVRFRQFRLRYPSRDIRKGATHLHEAYSYQRFEACGLGAPRFTLAGAWD